MNKKVWYTCEVVVLLIKPIIFWRSRCRPRRWILNSLLASAQGLKGLQQVPVQSQPPPPQPHLLVMIIRAWRYTVSKWVLFLNTIPKSWFCLWNSNIQSNAEFHGTGLLFKFWSNGNIFKENGYTLNDFSCLVVSFQSSKIPTIHVASEQ